MLHSPCFLRKAFSAVFFSFFGNICERTSYFRDLWTTPFPPPSLPPNVEFKTNLPGRRRQGGRGTEGALKVPIARSPLAVLLRPSPPVCYSETWGQSHATRSDRGGKRLSPNLSCKCSENVQRVTNKYSSLSERFKLIAWFLLVSPAQE